MSKHIESEKVIIHCQPTKVYGFIGNFNNFTKLLPEQVENWQSSEDSCSFEVKGLAKLGLRITGRTPYSAVCMESDGNLPFNFTLNTLISETAPDQCQVQLVIDSDMNQFIAMMAATPLTNFINSVAQKLKVEMEK